MIGLRKVESWVRNDMKSNSFPDNAKQKEEMSSKNLRITSRIPFVEKLPIPRLQ
jgi:hypothetical protein